MRHSAAKSMIGIKTDAQSADELMPTGESL